MVGEEAGSVREIQGSRLLGGFAPWKLAPVAQPSRFPLFRPLLGSLPG